MSWVRIPSPAFFSFSETYLILSNRFVKCKQFFNDDDGDSINDCDDGLKVATWKCPVSGRIDIPDYKPRAVAIICDECFRNKIKIRHCIEWECSLNQVTYHDVDNLADADEASDKMRYYFSRNFRQRTLSLKAARQEGVN